MKYEYVMYLIVRTDLKMGKGKIGAQCGHAVQYLTIRNLHKPFFKQYLNGSHPKIILKVPSLEEMNTISNYCYRNRIPYYEVIDSGKTQIPPKTKTVLGVAPLRRSEVPDIIKNLKLL